MSAGLSPSELVHKYATSIVDGDYDSFKSCLARDVQGKLQRDDARTLFLSGEPFLATMKVNYFELLEKAKETARKVFEDNGQWTCELELEQTMVYVKDRLTFQVKDTIAFKVKRVKGEWKIKSVSHHKKPTIDGKSFRTTRQYDGVFKVIYLN